MTRTQYLTVKPLLPKRFGVEAVISKAQTSIPNAAVFRDEARADINAAVQSALDFASAIQEYFAKVGAAISIQHEYFRASRVPSELHPNDFGAGTAGGFLPLFLKSALWCKIQLNQLSSPLAGFGTFDTFSPGILDELSHVLPNTHTRILGGAQ